MILLTNDEIKQVGGGLNAKNNTNVDGLKSETSELTWTTIVVLATVGVICCVCLCILSKQSGSGTGGHSHTYDHRSDDDDPYHDPYQPEYWGYGAYDHSYV